MYETTELSVFELASDIEDNVFLIRIFGYCWLSCFIGFDDME